MNFILKTLLNRLKTELTPKIFPCQLSYQKLFRQSEVHIEIYDSKYMNRTKIVSKSKKISKSKIFQICSGNHFSPRFMTPCSLLNENIFSVFRSPHLSLDTQFWTRGFPFATRARKREPCCLQSEVRIEI